MNHPSPEEMMEHLYGENSANPAHRQSVDAHLQQCAECRTRAQGWQQTQASLNAWRLPGASGHRPAGSGRIVALAARVVRPALRWAAAAALLISAGYVAGRTAAPSPAALSALVERQVSHAMNRERAALASNLRATARQTATQEARQLLGAVAQQLDARRQADSEALYATLQEFVEHQTVALSQLRQDLSTVAVVADARLVDTQEQILELANVRPEAIH